VRVEATDVTGFVGSSSLAPLRQESWEWLVRSQSRRPDFELGLGPFRVHAVRLPGLAGTLAWPTQPGRTFAHELAGRVRVIAGLDQPPILFHSEAWPREAGEHLTRLRATARCGEGDGLVIVWGPERDARTAAEEIRLRYVDAIDGVPNETRQPFRDGTTDFERILPGPDRMYPDTDSPPTRVTRPRVERLRAALPERPWEREARYAAVGVPEDTAHYLVRRGGARLVDRAVGEGGAELRFAAFFFGERVKGLRRSGVAVDAIPDPLWLELFRAFAARPALREAWAAIVTRLAGQPREPLDQALEALGLETAPGAWREVVPRWLEAAEREAYDGRPGRILRHATGRVCDALRGRVPAREVVAAVHAAAGGGR
jgi:Glu-tRNA(Gln) amidotransferase subunit E-like FAD-binding protein